MQPLRIQDHVPREHGQAYAEDTRTRQKWNSKRVTIAFFKQKYHTIITRYLSTHYFERTICVIIKMLPEMKKNLLLAFLLFLLATCFVYYLQFLHFAT